MVGLIQEDNEQAYREEVRLLVDRYNTNNSLLNEDNTKQIIVDCRKRQHRHTSLDSSEEITHHTLVKINLSFIQSNMQCSFKFD